MRSGLRHKAISASPGSTVAVRIDHDDRNKLAIDWAAPSRTRRRQ